MISPTKLAHRSPLKATDANAHTNTDTHANLKTKNVDITSAMENVKPVLKKRSLEKLEQINNNDPRKRPKIERNRSIEGAVVHINGINAKIDKFNDQTDNTNNDANKSTNNANKNTNSKQNKVSLNELLEWQNNWKKIMKRESKIYFDTTDDTDISKYMKIKLEKKRDLLRKGFAFLGAQITQFFDTSVTIVITRRSTEKIYLLQDTDVLSRAKKNYMKVWNYEKSTRFLKNLDVHLDQLEKSKNSLLHTTTSLSNLLQNEKLYGPSDRDPRTKRDDVHYFKHSYIYMYDLWQTWAPILTLEWKPQELADINNLPYPTLKYGTFGRCPFIGDGACDEMSYKRVVKRYTRDKSNKSYALRLRQLYQYHAEPNADKTQFVVIPHICLDSKQCYDKWQQLLTVSYSKNDIEQKAGEDLKQLTDHSHTNTADQLVEEDTTKGTPTVNEIETEKKNEDREDSKVTSLLPDKDENEDYITQANEPGETNWKEPLQLPDRKSLSTLSLNHQKLLGTLTRQETEEFPNDLCNSKVVNRFPQEIRASGVHQSNDVATSFGNGLGPTKSSVMSKNLKSLSRFVVDRKLGVKSNTNNQFVSTNKVHENTGASNTNPNLDEEKNNQKLQNNQKSQNNQNDNDEASTASKALTKKTATTKIQQQHQQQQTKEPAIMKNSGYCENCRVKYERLDMHINSERHQSFAQNEMNFESIDSLISKLHFQF
ncbi:hypothetical protein TPHA_0M01260 [Tetrapisispora phaffii CBS 4417]|uniref:DBF4-type domain-containing protein n=1 Tax=Tetrapisispora phaffii (strain ATCC 24235 / CBS 4417 / NBRC 1672 / NRRL Y-8282 / UCD 70-5) TaxID=1071381 RepID=G8C0I6_TETPH|nr:hypothetical protein TPHA_0M01260 [Tetrapisispora phaffii CBS 4417]CCE65701.1 hypothetical protein TPHA_0M01260 [Tetrapisispora phaffii CBS 4417]